MIRPHHIALVAATIATMLTSTRAETFSGDATTYGGNALGGTCGFQSPWSSWSTTSMGLTVALNAPQWSNSLNCGRCASVQYSSNAPVTVQIVDKCSECKHGDLDMDTAAYAAIIKKGPGREPITWSFVECPDLFATTTLEFVLKTGSNAFWAAFQPQNFKIGIQTLEINTGNGWKPLIRNEQALVGYYFVHTGGITGSFQLRATSVAGEQIVTPTYYSLEDVMKTEQQFTSTDETTTSAPALTTPPPPVDPPIQPLTPVAPPPHTPPITVLNVPVITPVPPSLPVQPAVDYTHSTSTPTVMSTVYETPVSTPAKHCT